MSSLSQHVSTPGDNVIWIIHVCITKKYYFKTGGMVIFYNPFTLWPLIFTDWSSFHYLYHDMFHLLTAFFEIFLVSCFVFPKTHRLWPKQRFQSGVLPHSATPRSISFDWDWKGRDWSSTVQRGQVRQLKGLRKLTHRVNNESKGFKPPRKIALVVWAPLLWH